MIDDDEKKNDRDPIRTLDSRVLIEGDWGEVSRSFRTSTTARRSTKLKWLVDTCWRQSTGDTAVRADVDV